jgi:hypothetical protein
VNGGENSEASLISLVNSSDFISAVQIPIGGTAALGPRAGKIRKY